ncbi:hypothetical protein ILUMI_01184 [Ignelater luminosus]|uniref:Uncharacterized protein n=1 Tax=Ignelater luminosus TaxID=2038154 RepID=A0A8K0DR74_IGNLU|nr:hypothetical protein ILUMI_01184 [Ignelater luminosus]
MVLSSVRIQDCLKVFDMDDVMCSYLEDTSIQWCTVNLARRGTTKPLQEFKFATAESKDKDDIYRLQKSTGENIEDRPSDECGIELLNKDNANNATYEKNLQHNFSINQPENVEEELVRDNETRLTSMKKVLVKIPDVDSDRLAPRNILAVALSEREDLYQLDTSTGVLQKLYARNEFQVRNSLVDAELYRYFGI